MHNPADLLPCPFCGKAPICCPDNSYGTASVFCPDINDCPVSPSADADLPTGETLQDAIAAWNTRATDREKLVRAVVERYAQAVKPYRGPPSDDELARGIRLGRSAALTAIRSLNIDDLVKDTGR